MADKALDLGAFREILEERDQLRDEKARDKEKIRALEKEAAKVAGLRRELEHVQRQLERTRVRERDLGGKLGDSEHSYRVLESELRETEENLANALRKLSLRDGQVRDVEEMKVEVQRARSERDRAQAERDTVREENERLQAHKEQTEALVSALETARKLAG